ITFYSTINGERVGSFAGHGAPIRGLAFHPDGRWLLSLDEAGVVKRWPVAARTTGSQFNDGYQIWAGKFAADDSSMYFGGADHGLQILDARSTGRVFANASPLAVVRQIKPSLGGTMIAASGRTSQDGEDWMLAVYDVKGNTRFVCESAGGDFAFSTDGQFLAEVDPA